MSALSPAAASARDLTDLPHDVFLLIVVLLSSEDAVVCRGVSRAWHRTFTAEHLSSQLLRWHFPHARESRAPRAAATTTATFTAATTTATFTAAAATDASCRRRDGSAAVFARVARRYHHLRAAKPRLIEKIDVAREADPAPVHRGVEPWNRKLRFNENTAAFQYRDPTWCMDDGLLVYPSPDGRYLAYDVATWRRFPVPFDGSDKTVRRLRLACGVLVIEWCEREPYHQLNDRETVHRHFATAYDVRRPSSRASSRPPQSSLVRSSADASWAVVFRSEWKIHFLGLPVNQRDRFFSAHSATHYAIYLWQPNRSPWGEEEPLEQLTIWDISFPSAYRPSEDPTGSQKPDADLGPVVTRRLSWRDLEFLGLRQRHTPSIRQLLLDDGHVYVHGEGHRWLSGPQSSLSLPRHHTVRSTGIPIVGFGPCWYDECCADGDLQMSFCPRSGSAAPGDASSSWGIGRSCRWAPCWRHEEFPYLTVTDMADDEAGVRIVARHCFMMEALSVFVAPRISVEHEGGDGEGSEVRFADDMWSEVLNKGCIYGDERWMVGEDAQGRVTIVRF